MKGRFCSLQPRAFHTGVCKLLLKPTAGGRTFWNTKKYFQFLLWPNKYIVSLLVILDISRQPLRVVSYSWNWIWKITNIYTAICDLCNVPCDAHNIFVGKIFSLYLIQPHSKKDLQETDFLSLIHRWKKIEAKPWKWFASAHKPRCVAKLESGFKSSEFRIFLERYSNDLRAPLTETGN